MKNKQEIIKIEEIPINNNPLDNHTIQIYLNQLELAEKINEIIRFINKKIK